jgi:hypothetical protein
MSNIVIVINGTTVSNANCTTNGQTTTCNINGTYGNVQVTGYPSGTAQVVATEGTLPLIKLINAKFRATANAVNGSVTFSGTSTAGTSKKMKRVASGWLVRVENTAAPYTSPTNRGQFNVDGVVNSASMTPTAESIDGIANGGDTSGQPKTVMNQAWVQGDINATTFIKTETMVTLTGSRTLKGEFTFYLPLTNDYLRLTNVTVETLTPVKPEPEDKGSTQGPKKI